MYLHQVAGALAAERRENPGDDLFSSLVNAEVDGDRLTDADVAAFFVLLAVAANDTTRQTTSHAMKALTDFPGERAWLLGGFENRIGTAVEEFIRWASPVMTFRRTAATDVELGGQSILAGEKVVMFYPSANWDTEAFDHPDRFDLGRTPNLARRFRRRRSALLPGGPCGAGATARDLRRAAAPAAGYPGRRSGLLVGQFHPRASAACPATSSGAGRRPLVRRPAAPAIPSSRRRP